MPEKEKITAELLLERFKENPKRKITQDEVESLDRDEYRRFLDLWLQTEEGRKQVVNWIMAFVEIYHPPHAVADMSKMKPSV